MLTVHKSLDGSGREFSFCWTDDDVLLLLYVIRQRFKFYLLSSLDVQLKPYRTDEFIHKLYYETSRFYAFSHQWVIKARINADQKDPTQSSERGISYQVLASSHYLHLNRDCRFR